MRESALWKRVRDGLLMAACSERYDTGRIRFSMDRIENSVGRSMADVAGVWHGREFWIELKVAAHWAVKFETGQAQWLRHRWECGSATFVLVGRPGGEVFLVSGEHAHQLEKDGLRKVPHVFHVTGHMTNGDWVDVLECLTWRK